MCIRDSNVSTAENFQQKLSRKAGYVHIPPFALCPKESVVYIRARDAHKFYIYSLLSRTLAYSRLFIFVLQLPTNTRVSRGYVAVATTSTAILDEARQASTDTGSRSRAASHISEPLTMHADNNKFS